MIAQPEITLDVLADATVPVFVTARLDAYADPFPLALTVTDEGTGKARAVELQFIGP